MRVRQPPVVEHLEQDGVRLRVRLLDLVEQDHRERAPAHRLGQLPAVLEPHIPRRGADQPRHRELLAVLAHVQPHHRLLVVEEFGGEGARQFRLPHPGRPGEQESPERPVRVADPGAGAEHGVRDRPDAFLLADHPPVERLRQPEQFRPLRFEQPLHRDPGPPGDHGRHIGVVHFLAEQLGLPVGLPVGPPVRRQPRLRRREFLPERRHRPEPQFGGAFQVRLALGALDPPVGLLDPLAQPADRGQPLLLPLPPGAERPGGVLALGDAAREFRPPRPRGGVLVLLERLPLDPERQQLPLHLVEFGGDAVHLGAQPGGGLVHQVDRLVRQEPPGDVAVGERRRGQQRRVPDADAVVHLVPLLQPAEDGDGRLAARLLDQDGLEPPLQRRVFLDVAAVLVEGGRADAVEFAAGERRLEQVRGVHRPGGRAGADHGVEFVHEQDDLPAGAGDRGEHRLQPLLELAPELRPGHQRPEVERRHPVPAEPFGHIALHDADGQPFGDRGLPDPRLAQEHRVVLGPAGEDLDDPPDLVVAPDDRVEPVLRGQRGEIAAVALQRGERGLRVGGGDPGGAAHLPDGGFEGFALHSALPEEGRRRRAPVGQREEEVLDAHILVAEPGRFLRRAAEVGGEFPGHRGVAGAAALMDREFAQFPPDAGERRRRLHGQAAQQAGDESLDRAFSRRGGGGGRRPVFQERREQVERRGLRVPPLLGEFAGAFERPPGPYGELDGHRWRRLLSGFLTRIIADMSRSGQTN